MRWFIVLALVAAQTAEPEKFTAASVDKNGALAIDRHDGPTIAVYKRGEQTRFDKPRLSPDRTAVGAQAMYPNCCTSYDIPLRLVVYENGREHWFKGVGLPIFWWRFEDSSCGTNYELRDVRSEQLVDAVLVPEEESSGCPPWPAGTKPTRIPDWVKRLRLTRGR